MEAGRAGDAAQAARRRGDRLRRLRLRPRPRARRPLPAAHPDRAAGRRFEVVGEFDVEARRLRQRPRSPSRSMARDFGQTQDTLRLRQARRRAPTPTTVQALLDKRRRSGLPDRRSAQPAGTEGKPRRTGRHSSSTSSTRCSSLAVIDLAVRDRQHAGALDPRAHPGAGDAAGDRHVAPPGADDDPLRGGDHGPDRGDPRHGPRRDLRGADRPAAQGRRLHPLLPGRLAGRCCWSSPRSPACSRRSRPARRASRLDVLEALQYE